MSCVQVKEFFTSELFKSSPSPVSCVQVKESFTGELLKSSQVNASFIQFKGKCGCHP